MRTLIIVLLIASSALAWEKPIPVNLGNYYIGYSVIEQDNFHYETFLEYHYHPVLHTFILLDGWKYGVSASHTILPDIFLPKSYELREITESKEEKFLDRNTGLVGVIVPGKELDFGIGLGNNYPTGSVYMTLVRYHTQLLNVNSIFQFGSTRPAFKLESSFDFGVVQLKTTYISNYGLDAGLALLIKRLLLGVSYSIDHSQWQFTLALNK